MIWEFGYVLIEESESSSRILAFSDSDDDDNDLESRAQELNNGYSIECSKYFLNKDLLLEFQEKYYSEYYIICSKDRSFSKEKLQKWLNKSPIPDQLQQFIEPYFDEGLLGISDDPSYLDLKYFVKEIKS